MTSEAMTAILATGSSIALPDSDRIEERRATTSAALSGPLTDGTAAEWADLGGRPALWIHPAARAESGRPTLLYLHGGAFEVGSPTDYQAFCSRLASRLDATVVTPDYRLAPEHPFPAAVDDVVGAYRDLLDAGRPASSIALVGDSAGGGLVLSCLIAAHRAGLPQPAAAVGLSTWGDLTLDADAHERCAASDPFITRAMLHRAAHNYLAGTDPRDPLASPVHATPEELADLAPILLHAAANEVLADDSTTMAEHITAAGGDVTIETWPEAFHAWHMAGDGIPESADALDQVLAFIEEHWRRP
jgi:monoterpene epsilon-lactone hydrolase